MILKKLREATAENHTSLEETELLLNFRNKTITIETYTCILKKFYGFYLVVEKQLNQFSEISTFLKDYPERRKTKTLSDDLTLLQSDIGSIPPATDTPNLSCLSHAFGCLYVLEGSTLGGRIISKVLKETIGIDSTNGGKYFNGYGENTGTRWKFFCEALTSYSDRSKEDDLIICGANETFSKLRIWLQ